MFFPSFARRALVALPFAVAANVLAAAPASSTENGDPLFGEGCRVVYVETPTPLRPEVEVCRPF